MIVIAGYASNATTVVACMCLAGGATGMIYAGFQVNILDIAPRYAGIVMGICNSIGSAAGVPQSHVSWLHNTEQGKYSRSDAIIPVLLSLLAVSKRHTKTKAKDIFSVGAPKLWDELPEHTRSFETGHMYQ